MYYLIIYIFICYLNYFTQDKKVHLLKIYLMILFSMKKKIAMKLKILISLSLIKNYLWGIIIILLKNSMLLLKKKI
jgi:hypothetical protein